ncbi:MAG: COG1361 S-layer family protein [Enterocloster bolteae]
MGRETGGSGADSVSGAQDGGSQEGSGGRVRGKEDSNNPDDGAPGSGSLWVGEYEIFAPGGSKDTLDVLRKGRQAKVVVNVRSNGIKTSEVGKRGVTVTKLSDSFRNGENPKVKITSDKEDDLEFTVTFTRLTYTGKGDVLRLKVGFKSSGIPSEQLEVNISECEESAPRENGDTGSTTGQPIIRVRRISPQNPVGPGDHFTLEVELENTSKDADIEDMVVNVSPGSSLFIGGDTNTRIVSRLDTGRAELVKFNLIAGQDISGPSQLIDLELKYNYYSGGQLTSAASVQKVLLPVKGGTATGQPVLLIDRGPMGPVSSGQPFQITLKLENTDTVKGIRNLTATFEPNDQISLLEATDTRQIGDIGPGQSVDVSVNLKAGSELSSAASQLLGITLKFDYDTDKGTVQGTYSQRIVVPTNGKTATPGAPTPNIILTNYTYGDKVSAGQVFRLNMEFMNTSQVSPIENVVISLETGEGLSINSSSNTFYVPKMGPGEKKAQQVDVQALFQTKDSKVQSPKITISCKYEYIDKTERKQSTAAETIAVPVYQPDRFQVSPPSFVEEIRQNEETTISLPYVNKGRGQVYNVEASLEGDIQVIDRSLNLGNFDAGKSGTIDFIATPKKAGTFEGRVKVTYEDESMEIRTMEIPVTFEVKEGAAEETDGADMMDGEMDGGRKMNWKMMAGILTAALVAGILWIKRNKAKGLKDRKRCQEQNGWDELEDGQNLEGWDELEDSQDLEGWDELEDSQVLEGWNELEDSRDQPSENEEDKS